MINPIIMHLTRNLTLILLTFFYLISCSAEPELGSAPTPDNYEQEIADWIDYRVGVLTEPTGWLRMVDLQWLNEGENSFGSGEEMDIQFPAGTIPEYAGTFIYNNDDEVIMNVADDVIITHEDEPVEEFTLYDGQDRPHVIHDTMEWFIDVRDEQVGIRIYNHDTPKADAFTGFPRYPLQPEWHKKARFIEYDEPKTMQVDDVIDRTLEVTSPGQLQFSVDGELYTLDTIESSGRLFIMFSDATSQTETYQAGRYMLVPYPDEGEETTILDFNKAYNPPCAFSVFTTCQLPPPQNRLDIAITAGEKRPVNFEGR